MGRPACNPYDTERVPRGSSSGSGVAVSASFATCGICEQTSGSCKGPASRNGIVNLLTTKGILMDGGYGYKNIGDRAGIHCRTVADAVKVLDAAKGFDTKGHLQRAADEHDSEAAVHELPRHRRTGAGQAPEGMRFAIAREFMVKFTKNDVAISDQADKEIKAVLRDKLGAELVETLDPKYADDPSVPNAKFTFNDAIAEVLPGTVPEFFWQKSADGKLEFEVPGWDVTSPEYLVALSRHKAPLSPKLSLRRLYRSSTQVDGPLGWDRYLADRGRRAHQGLEGAGGQRQIRLRHLTCGRGELREHAGPRVKPDDISLLKMHTVLQMVILKVDARERHRRVRESGEHAAALQAGPGLGAGNRRP
ncbi:MAG: amidase family protein [Gammaproteobacteria bacterium]